MAGIRAGGAEEYQRALRQEYATARERLQARLAQSPDPVERQTLLDELEHLHSDFDKRLKGISRCMFGAG